MGFIPITALSILPDILIQQPLLPYHISFLLLGIIPIAYGYAILQDRLLSMEGRVARSAANVLVFSLTSGLFLILITMTNRLLPDDAARDPIVLTIMVLVFAALYAPTQHMFKQLVNRALYGTWYDYRSLVIHSTRKLSRTNNKDRLVSCVLDIITTMHFPAAAFFLPVGDQLRCQGRMGFLNTDTAADDIPIDGLLARSLCHLNRPEWNSRVRQMLVGQSLTATEKQLLFHKAPALWIPLITKGALRGLLFLESQFAEEWMSSDDLIILATLGALAALSSENVDLLDAIQTQLEFTEQARAELQESRQRLLEGREAERLHLARELHDGPIQDLHAIRLLFAKSNPATADPSREQIQARILTIIHNLRDICMQLRPPALTYFGLEAAMRSLADHFRTNHPNISLDLSIEPGERSLSEQASLALYRIYQEALNNIDQHAQATHVRVIYTVSDLAIRLEIRDDGLGFEVPPNLLDIARRGHLGLLGASERAESIGGELNISSAPGQGTQLQVRVPLNGSRTVIKNESIYPPRSP